MKKGLFLIILSILMILVSANNDPLNEQVLKTQLKLNKIFFSLKKLATQIVKLEEKLDKNKEKKEELEQEIELLNVKLDDSKKKLTNVLKFYFFEFFSNEQNYKVEINDYILTKAILTSMLKLIIVRLDNYLKIYEEKTEKVNKLNRVLQQIRSLIEKEKSMLKEKEKLKKKYLLLLRTLEFQRLSLKNMNLKKETNFQLPRNNIDKNNSSSEKILAKEFKGKLFGKPLLGKIEVLIGFGENKTPSGVKFFNPGIDIKGKERQEVYSIADGKIIFKGKLPNLGNVVIEKSGEYKIIYANLGQIEVDIGDGVSKGQRIGYLPTFDEAVPYLHLEIIKNGKKLNPENLIDKEG